MICCLSTEPGSSAPAGALEAIARTYSPRVRTSAGAALFDVGGLDRLVGPPDRVAAGIHRLAAERGLTVRLAVAGTATAAWLLARVRPGTTIVPVGADGAALESLPLRELAGVTTLDQAAGAIDEAGARAAAAEVAGCLAIFERWGLTSMGEIARLPREDVHARMGDVGVRLHQAASGEDARPFVSAPAVSRFVERVQLDWPIDGLEPLSFVLARPCELLSLALERADRGAVVLRTTLHLVSRDRYERVLQLPAPLRDSRVLRTLILLDLEAHPPPAAIDAVDIEAGVAPGPILQGELFEPAVPSAGTLTTLLARLGALMGPSRVGAPALPDTHDRRAVAMTRFAVETGQGGRTAVARGLSAARSARVPSAFCLLSSSHGSSSVACLRRFRLPVSARVTVEQGAPVLVIPSARGLAGGRVLTRAGPWRSSGGWWAPGPEGAWDRDEWDLEFDDGVYRVVRHRPTGHWQVEGVFD